MDILMVSHRFAALESGRTATNGAITATAPSCGFTQFVGAAVFFSVNTALIEPH
jgi:hypothetical protein